MGFIWLDTELKEINQNRWLLPDGVQETLPPDAREVEILRYQILSLFQSWGYDLVMPAMIEYRDSLLTGPAHALDVRTFALVDQLSGRQMGVRSDMTPQVARIDAHLLANDDDQLRISRLCYCGHLLHTLGEGVNSSRTPLQIGAEIFGCDLIGADVEVASLMIETLQAVGLSNISVDFGHVGIFRSLMKQAGLDPHQENQLFDMLQRKSIPDLNQYLQALTVEAPLREQICQLALLNGDVSTIDKARDYFAGASADLHASLDAMQQVVAALSAKYPKTSIHCDLAELRGYDYHTGLVFAAFIPGQGAEIARGGRYDDIGRVFGKARPATGFSADLLSLYQISNNSVSTSRGILAPDLADDRLNDLIQHLRADGERVVVDLTQASLCAVQQHCDRQIAQQNNDWVVVEVE